MPAYLIDQCAEASTLNIGGRTHYNGFYGARIVKVTSPAERPSLIEG